MPQGDDPVPSAVEPATGATVAARLPAYVEAGWLDPQDVPMLASLQRRRQAVDWVEGQYGGQGARALREFQHAATGQPRHRTGRR